MRPTIVNDPTDLDAIRVSISTGGPTCLILDSTTPTAQDLRLRTSLAPDEINRANRFRFEQDRSAYLCARALIRRVLADHGGCLPEAVRIEVAANQKPSAPDIALSFSITHSKGIVAVCFLASGAIGCDLEFAPRTKLSALPEIATHVFASDERAALDSLMPQEDEARGFFLSVWRRKEAVLKAAGLGFSGQPSGFSMLDPNGEFASCLCYEDRVWTLAELDASPDIRLAIAWSDQP